MLESRGGVSGPDGPPPKQENENYPRGKGSIINVASLVSFQGAKRVVILDSRSFQANCIRWTSPGQAA